LAREPNSLTVLDFGMPGKHPPRLNEFLRCQGGRFHSTVFSTKELVKPRHRRQVMFGYGLDRHFKHGRVVGVGKQVAVGRAC